MSNPRISYARRPDDTQATELCALANVYLLLLESAKKRGRVPDKSCPDDAMKGPKHDRANTSISK
jgi:hypothetical protein